MYALRVKNLCKVYSNGKVALQDLSFEVQQGEFCAVLGANGAGKSTAIGIITTLVNKSSGTVEISGFDLAIDPKQAKQLVGLMPQEFNFNVFEKVINVLITQAGYYGIGVKVATQRAEYYLKRFGLWEQRFNPVRNLSGGMKRRLMVIRALMNDPKILILDEPTAGVDVELRHLLWDFLKEYNSLGNTIILTSHYLEEVEELCTRVILIAEGKLIADELVANIKKEKRLEKWFLQMTAKEKTQ